MLAEARENMQINEESDSDTEYKRNDKKQTEHTSIFNNFDDPF